jgi:hypothetical protein
MHLRFVFSKRNLFFCCFIVSVFIRRLIMFYCLLLLIMLLFFLLIGPISDHFIACIDLPLFETRFHGCLFQTPHCRDWMCSCCRVVRLCSQLLTCRLRLLSSSLSLSSVCFSASVPYVVLLSVLFCLQRRLCCCWLHVPFSCFLCLAMDTFYTRVQKRVYTAIALSVMVSCSGTDSLACSCSHLLKHLFFSGVTPIVPCCRAKQTWHIHVIAETTSRRLMKHDWSIHSNAKHDPNPIQRCRCRLRGSIPLARDRDRCTLWLTNICVVIRHVFVAHTTESLNSYIICYCYHCCCHA